MITLINIDQVPEAIVLVKPTNHKILRTNSYIKDIIGSKASSLEHQNISELLHDYSENIH